MSSFHRHAYFFVFCFPSLECKLQEGRGLIYRVQSCNLQCPAQRKRSEWMNGHAHSKGLNLGNLTVISGASPVYFIDTLPTNKRQNYFLMFPWLPKCAPIFPPGLSHTRLTLSGRSLIRAIVFFWRKMAFHYSPFCRAISLERRCFS